jgi:hypothetical protein
MPVVRTTEKAQVRGLGAATLAGGLAMVELQPGSAAAAVASVISPAATEPVALDHRAASRARYLCSAVSAPLMRGHLL